MSPNKLGTPHASGFTGSIFSRLAKSHRIGQWLYDKRSNGVIVSP